MSLLSTFTIEVIAALMHISVRAWRQGCPPESYLFAQSIGNDSKGIGDTVLSVKPVELGDRGQRSDSAVAVTSVHRVCAGRERLAHLAAVRRRAGSFAVSDVGGNGEYRSSNYTLAVCLELTQITDKGMQDILSDAVDPVVVVAELGELALSPVIDHNAGLVADRIDLSILDGGQRVCHDGQTGYTGGEPAGNLLVVQSHLQTLIAILIMHIMDNIQRIDIQPGQPLHHIVIFAS